MLISLGFLRHKNFLKRLTLQAFQKNELDFRIALDAVCDRQLRKLKGN
jgi:hypothetical protein